MKNAKKVITILLSVILLVSLSLVMVACKDGDGTKKETRQTTVMNVSLNPEVEFILDVNGKVVSVNALNEEGNIVISGEVNFVGKTQDEALKAFVQVTKDNGFLVTGNASADDNQVSVSFSGDQAQKRYEEAKTALTKAFKDSGITASVESFQAFATDYLDKQIAEAMPYLEAAKIQALSYEEKIATLEESRKETAALYSEQLKQAYYDAKERAVEAAKLNYVKENANAMAKMALTAAETGYNMAITALENTRKAILLDENSAYQLALKAFRAAKVQYLNYRNYVAGLSVNVSVSGATASGSVDVNLTLANLDAAVDSAEKALNDAYALAEQSFAQAKTAADTAYNAIISAITSADSNCQTYLDQASQNLTTAINNFDTTFAADYKTYIDSAKTSWNNMSAELKAGYTEEK